ncbi:MAG TPA: hypothetical protein VEN81_02915, partial [Planctomycetota bacterium]|nr:hypothetical protein [Planctomycetota bacterium]
MRSRRSRGPADPAPMTAYEKLILRGGPGILAATLALAGAGAWVLRGFQVEAGTDVLLDQSDRDLAYYNQSRVDWETDEYVIVCCHRNEGWLTPGSLDVLNDLTRQLRSLPNVLRVLSITRVPLLRNRPMMMGLPVPVYLADEEGRPNAKVDLEKARREFLGDPEKKVSGHTQALGNLISPDARDLSILVYLNVPDDLMRLEPERNRLLGRPRDAETARRLSEIEQPYQDSIQENNRRRTLLVDGIRRLGAEVRPKLDEPVRLSGLPIINIVLREHIKADIGTFG